MSDCFTPQERSRVMRAVKSTRTVPERTVAAVLRDLRIGYRLGGWGLPGKPDFTFPGRKAVVFVHGCFWHGHDCKRGARAPKANAAYWRAKIARNQARDARALVALSQAGWRTLVLWECELVAADTTRDRLGSFLVGSEVR